MENLMPRYFVHVRIGSTVVHDTEGEDFEDMGAASAAAAERSRRVLQRALPQLEVCEVQEIEITEG
jgi:hypothetical protein